MMPPYSKFIVKRGMLAWCEKLKILYRIIRLAEVFVVNNKALRYLPKALFPEKSVEEFLLTVDQNKDISVPVCGSRSKPLFLFNEKRTSVSPISGIMLLAKGLSVKFVTASFHRANFHMVKCFSELNGVQ